MKTSSKIKDMIKANSAVTIKEMANALGRQPRTIEIAISKLRTNGEVLREGIDKNGKVSWTDDWYSAYFKAKDSK